ncbi:uncharacterized protein [Dermacentor andersoni]|uniref:uncharacterized protein n=1 Tax=Dermacentor andersoni TaxID=34620 RepID=UPI0021553626|nr:uncharacterized protein LOC126529055 [Dermacentor andersoni]
MASRMSLAAAALLMVILLVVALSSAQEYPPPGRPGGSGRDCHYLCFLDNCNRRKCYYTCNRPRYCEEQASLLLTAGSAAVDGGVVSAFPSQADDVDDADVPDVPSAPAATPSA